MPRLSPTTIATLSSFDCLFIRHGNTAPNPVDTERVLTDKGRQQCAAAAQSYMTQLSSGLASFALCSPAVRCLETARLVIGPKVDLSHIRPMYDALLQPGASGVFKKLGYAPLSTYFADGPEVTAVLNEYATTVLDAAASEVNAVKRVSCEVAERQTLCFVGHAVYSGAIAHALAVARGLPPASLAAIDDYNMQEACAMWVGATEAKVLEHDLVDAPYTKRQRVDGPAPSSSAKSFIDKLALILVRDRKQLVARSKGKAAFFTPGGKREAGESDEDALVRECKEELTVEIDRATIKPCVLPVLSPAPPAAHRLTWCHLR